MKFTKRFFLDKVGAASMVVETTDTDTKGSYFAADVAINDGSHNVLVGFSCNKKTRAERLRKLRAIINTLEELGEVLENYEFGKSDPEYL